MNSTRSSLTNTERRILAVLFRREADLMLPPTMRELAEESGVFDLRDLWPALRSLRGRRLLTWQDGVARSVRLTCQLVNA